MKKYSLWFDIITVQSFLCFIFSGILYFLGDRFALPLFYFACLSFIVSLVLGVWGLAFDLFEKWDAQEDF